MTGRALAAAFLFVTVGVGCATGGTGAPCDTESDCSGGQICAADGRCRARPSCVVSSACPAVRPCAPAQCLDGECRYGAGRDCAAGETCTSSGCATGVDGGADACVPRPEVCDGADQDCDGFVDEGELGCTACAVGTGDCDDNPDNGCETSLSTLTDCGGCGVPCEATDPCQTSPRCEAGECRFDPAPASTMCRAPSCGTDPAEICDGASTTCPASCGCDGEPCCADGCVDGFSCQAGVCAPCVTTTPTVSGSFGIMGETLFDSVSASGTQLTFGALNGSSGSLTLGGGVTATGSFTASGGGYLNAVMSSGNQITFVDRAGVSGTITLDGATASGGGTSPPIVFMGGGIPGFIMRVASTDDGFELHDSLGTSFATVTLGGVEVCP